MKILEFKTRKEVMKFLDDKYNFQYYIPRLCEALECKFKKRVYEIELNENNELVYCAIATTFDSDVVMITDFFNPNLVHIYKDTRYNKKQRELDYTNKNI